MSYHRRPSRSIARYGRVRPAPMSGWFSDLFAPVSVPTDPGVATAEEQLKCLAQAEASASIKQIDAKISNLIDTWHPTGIFTGADITKMVKTLEDATAQARAVLVDLPANSYGIANARGYLDNNDARISAYRSAVATSGGKKIPAPNFKKDVVNSLVNVRNAFVTESVIKCHLTWGQKALAIIDHAIDVAKSILGTIMEIGEKAANAVKAPLDIIAWLGKYPYIPIGIVAVLMYKKYSAK